MKPSEILAALPPWAKATAAEILASPAWTMPCRLENAQCTMRLDAVRPAETLDLTVRFEHEEHILGIPDSPNFKELHAIWPSRANVPPPILLALVEKDCGALFQLLENAVRRQLQVVDLAPASSGPDEQTLFAQIYSAEGEPVISFSLSSSPALVAALGQLRYIDATHPSILDLEFSAETEYAAFALPADDLHALSPGDAILLPEINAIPPRAIVDRKLLVSQDGVSEWKDDGLLHIFAEGTAPIRFGAIVDAKASNLGTLLPNAHLRLVRSFSTLARGHFGTVGAHPAFIAESRA